LGSFDFYESVNVHDIVHWHFNYPFHDLLHDDFDRNLHESLLEHLDYCGLGSVSRRFGIRFVSSALAFLARVGRSFLIDDRGNFHYNLSFNDSLHNTLDRHLHPHLDDLLDGHLNFDFERYLNDLP